MRQREVNRRAARRAGVQRELMARCVGAWLREVEELVAAGEPVSLSPLGRIQPIELAEDRRRKRRGVKFKASPYFSEVLANQLASVQALTLGEVVPVNWDRFVNNVGGIGTRRGWHR